MTHTTMRKIAYLLPLALSLAFVAFARPAGAFYETNLVQNGSFEAGNDGHWTGDTDIIGTWSPIAWHGGSQGVRFQGDCIAPICDSTRTIRQTVVLPAPATALTLRMWYRNNNSFFNLRVINAANPSDVWADFELGLGDYTPNWTLYVTDLTAHAGQSAVIELAGDIWWSPFYTYIDDVSLVADRPDLTPPVTTATLSALPTGVNGFYTVPPAVSLTAADDSGGSGVAGTFAKWDTDAVFGLVAGPLAAPQGIHTLSYYSQDGAGNAETVKTLTVKLDSIAPTATVTYSTTSNITGPVTATLVPSEPVTVTNNAGAFVATFPVNGSFTFTFVDAAGNPGQTVATVGNIVPAAPATPAVSETPVSTPASAPASPSAPAPIVLGAKTSRPTITSIRLKNGTHSFKVGKQTKKLQPFSAASARTVAKRITFSNGTKVFLFLNAGPAHNGSLTLYSATGKRLGTWLPYGTAATTGLNADFMVQDNDRVYVAVGWNADGRRAQVYEVTAKRLKLVRTLDVAANQRGSVELKFVKGTNDRANLVTMLKGQRSTIRFWTYRAAARTFLQDVKFNTNRVSTAGGRITLNK